MPYECDGHRRALVALAGLFAGLLLVTGVAGAQGQLQVEVHDGVVTLAVEEMPLMELLEEIARQSGLVVELEEPLAEPVSLELTGVPLVEALQQVLRGRNYVYQRSGSSRGVEGSPVIRPGRLWVLSGGAAREHLQAVTVEPCQNEGLDESRIATTGDCPGRLEIALTHSDARVRLAAISELTDAGGDGAAETLAAALTDDDVAVREEAIYGLGEVGDEESLPALQQALVDPDRRVREAAIDAVATIGGDGSAWALAVSLNDEHPALREEAVYALGSIGGEAARVLLQQALVDEHDFIREAAAETLEELPE
jgi:hypothetical protein